MAEMGQAPKGGGVGRGPSDLPRRPRQIAHRYGWAIFDLAAVGAHLPAVEDRLVPVPVILRRSGVIHGGTGVIEVALHVPRSSPERSKSERSSRFTYRVAYRCGRGSGGSARTPTLSWGAWGSWTITLYWASGATRRR